MTETATIVEGPDTTQMSAWPPTREEKNHLEGEAQEMSHLIEREGVEKIAMNEDPPEEVRTQRIWTSTPRDTVRTGFPGY